MPEDMKMSIVGHSQGTTEIFYGMIRQPEFFKKNVNLFIGLGPIVKITKLAPFNKIIIGSVYKYGSIQEEIGIYDSDYYF
jgi:hypothetical protein